MKKNKEFNDLKVTSLSEKRKELLKEAYKKKLYIVEIFRRIENQDKEFIKRILLCPMGIRWEDWIEKLAGEELI